MFIVQYLASFCLFIIGQQQVLQLLSFMLLLIELLVDSFYWAQTDHNHNLVMHTYMDTTKEEILVQTNAKVKVATNY